MYSLPFHKSELKGVVSHPKEHFAHFKDAIDFLLPEGAEVLSADDGILINIEQDSKEGGADPKYNDIKYLNYITLEHPSGEYSQYMHIAYKSCPYEVGDKVKRGDVIAKVGLTGLTTEYHLHFQVFHLCDSKEGWETIEPEFDEEIKVDRSNTQIQKDLEEELERVRSRL